MEGTWNFLVIRMKLLVKNQSNITQKKQQDSSESSDDNTRKKKYKPYEEISGEFKNIKPTMFNGEIEKCEEAEAWLSRMKNYFQIYNYSDNLKAKISIYNLTGR